MLKLSRITCLFLYTPNGFPSRKELSTKYIEHSKYSTVWWYGSEYLHMYQAIVSSVFEPKVIPTDYDLFIQNLLCTLSLLCNGLTAPSPHYFPVLRAVNIFWYYLDWRGLKCNYTLETVSTFETYFRESIVEIVERRDKILFWFGSKQL